MECRICSEELHGPLSTEDQEWDGWQQEHGICHRCRNVFGLGVRAQPSARPRGPCARCSCPQLVRVLVRERTGEYDSMVPMALTFARETKSSFWEGKTANTPDRGRPLGILDAYVCRGCGFVEWYAREPDRIPIGPEHGTELVDAAGPAYR